LQGIHNPPSRTLLGAKAGNGLVIDDNTENLEPARSVGMDAPLFEGAEKLKRDLVAV